MGLPRASRRKVEQALEGLQERNAARRQRKQALLIRRRFTVAQPLPLQPRRKLASGILSPAELDLFRRLERKSPLPIAQARYAIRRLLDHIDAQKAKNQHELDTRISSLSR
jgi:hypothetical protein